MSSNFGFEANIVAILPVFIIWLVTFSNYRDPVCLFSALIGTDRAFLRFPAISGRCERSKGQTTPLHAIDIEKVVPAVHSGMN